MIRGKYLSINDDLSDLLNIRQTVFSFKNRPVSPLAMNVLVYEQKSPVATGSIIYEDGIFTIEGIAVLSQHRKKGYGEFALRLLADKAMVAGGKEVFLECEKGVCEFFKKYNFEIYEDNENLVKMKVDLTQFKPACGGCSS